MAADNKSYSHKETYKTVLKMAYTTKQAAKALGLSYDQFVYVLREDLITVEDLKRDLPPKPKKQQLAETREKKLFFVMKDKRLPLNLIAEHLEITMPTFYKQLVDISFYRKCMRVARSFKNPVEEPKKKREELKGIFSGGNPIHDWDFFGSNLKK